MAATCLNTRPICYDFSGDPPSLGCYIDCVLPQIFDVIAVLGVATAIALSIWLVFLTIRNTENPEFLQTLGQRWVLLLLFIIIVATRGGIIFIPLSFIGISDIESYEEFYQQLIDITDVTRGDGYETIDLREQSEGMQETVDDELSDAERFINSVDQSIIDNANPNDCTNAHRTICSASTSDYCNKDYCINCYVSGEVDIPSMCLDNL